MVVILRENVIHICDATFVMLLFREWLWLTIFDKQRSSVHLNSNKLSDCF